ncbi:MAG: hypothetical protein U0793_13820 [Gemmataceae bacterium]
MTKAEHLKRRLKECERRNGWKEPDDAMRCWEAEERVAVLLILFRRITELEESTPLADRPPDFDATVIGLYRDWLAAAEKWERPIVELDGRGYEVEGTHQFQEAIRETQGILTPDNEFFDHPRLWHARDKAIKASRRKRTKPNPRRRSKTISAASKK